MKTAVTTMEIISALNKARKTYGEHNVEVGIHTILGWHYTYGKEAWQITIANQFIFIALKTASHSMLEADLVFDMEHGQVTIDSRGLINEQAMDGQSTAAPLRSV